MPKIHFFLAAFFCLLETIRTTHIASIIYFKINLGSREYFIIQHAQLVITNDTGPMHFAISFHTPVIAIFGPTPPNYAVDKNRSPSLIAMRAKAVCPGSNKCTIFNSMDKERAEEIRQICNKKNQICTDMITVESVTCVAQRVLSASCFSIS